MTPPAICKQKILRPYGASSIGYNFSHQAELLALIANLATSCKLDNLHCFKIWSGNGATHVKVFITVMNCVKYVLSDRWTRLTRARIWFSQTRGMPRQSPRIHNQHLGVIPKLGKQGPTDKWSTLDITTVLSKEELFMRLSMQSVGDLLLLLLAHTHTHCDNLSWHFSF